MKNFKILLGITVIALLMFSSCTKEALDDPNNLELLLSQYPDEITIDNWEEFVYAPQEVLDYFLNKERINQSQVNFENDSDNIEFRGNQLGWVRQFDENGNAIPLSGVDLIYGTQTATTTGNTGNNFCINININPTPTILLELSYDTDWMDGISTLDIVFIQQYILGLNSFDSWQKVAADINRDGNITDADIVLLRLLILGVVDTLPGSNVVFVSKVTYDYSNTLLSYLSNAPNEWNVFFGLEGYAIKTGDVTGNFAR